MAMLRTEVIFVTMLLLVYGHNPLSSTQSALPLLLVSSDRPEKLWILCWEKQIRKTLLTNQRCHPSLHPIFLLSCINSHSRLLLSQRRLTLDLKEQIQAKVDLKRQRVNKHHQRAHIQNRRKQRVHKKRRKKKKKKTLGYHHQHSRLNQRPLLTHSHPLTIRPSRHQLHRHHHPHLSIHNHPLLQISLQRLPYQLDSSHSPSLLLHKMKHVRIQNSIHLLSFLLSPLLPLLPLLIPTTVVSQLRNRARLFLLPSAQTQNRQPGKPDCLYV